MTDTGERADGTVDDARAAGGAPNDRSRGALLRSLAVLAIVLFGASWAGGAPKAPRIVIPIQEYLPRDAGVFLSVPNSATLLDVLKRTGEGEKTLYGDVTRWSGVKAGTVKALLHAFLAAADGPISLCADRESLPGQVARTDVLFSAYSKERGDRLKKAVDELYRGVIAPSITKKLRVERLMGLPVYHLAGKAIDLYLSTTRGYSLLSTSPLLLGRVLKEMQGPSGATLAHAAAFEKARKELKVAPGDGFFFVRGDGLPHLAKVIGVTSAAGVLKKHSQGYLDEALLEAEPGGILSHLAKSGEVPSAWSKTSARSLWVGADLDSMGALGVALAMVGSRRAPVSVGVGDVAAGPLELVYEPGDAPMARLLLKPKIKDDSVLAPLSDISIRKKGVLLVCSEKSELKRADPGGAEKLSGSDSAVVRAPVPLLVGLLGRKGAPGDKATTWAFDRGKDGVIVSSGYMEAGPFAVALASALR